MIKLLDESEIKDDLKDNVSNIKLCKKEEIINCERMVIGLLNNCAMCEHINKEIFKRCKNRFRY